MYQQYTSTVVINMPKQSPFRFNFYNITPEMIESILRCHSVHIYNDIPESNVTCAQLKSILFCAMFCAI